MRKNLAPLKWRPIWWMREREFAALLDSAAGERSFDEKYIERVHRRRTDLERDLWKLTVTNLVLLTALFLNAVVLPPDLSIAGLKASDVGKVKELLLFVSATLSVFAAMMNYELQALKSVTYAWLRKKYPKELFEYLKMPYGQRAGEIPNMRPIGLRHHFPTAFADFAGVSIGLMLLTFLATLFAASLVVYVAIVKDVVINPSLPSFWSWAVIVYAGACYLINLAFTAFMWLPVPYRDYSLSNELSHLAKVDPVEYKRRIDEMATQKKS